VACRTHTTHQKSKPSNFREVQNSPFDFALVADERFPGSNIVNVKAHNMQAVLLSLLTVADSAGEQPLSRIQLAHTTNLSSTTITNLVAELIEQGIVTEDKTPTRMNSAQWADRAPVCAWFRMRAMLWGCISGWVCTACAVMNLRAEMLCNKMVNFEITMPAFEVLQAISNDIQFLLTAAAWTCAWSWALVWGLLAWSIP